MTSPHTSGSSPTPPPDPGGRGARARERRAVRWGLAISAILHLVAIGIYPILMQDPAADQPTLPETTPDEVLPGFEVLTLRDEAEPEPEPPPPDPPVIELQEPDEPDEPEVELPVVEPPPLPIPAPEVDAVVPDEADDPEDEADRRTIAERLRPGPADARLWSELLPETSSLSDSERANLLLEGMLQSFNDSVAVAAALRGQMEDWTFTDDEGRRWGLSPGRLHLGDFSIPLPISFEIPPGLANDFARRDWEIADILRGSTSAEIRSTWSERAREIRQRMDAERERGGGG